MRRRGAFLSCLKPRTRVLDRHRIGRKNYRALTIFLRDIRATRAYQDAEILKLISSPVVIPFKIMVKPFKIATIAESRWHWSCRINGASPIVGKSHQLPLLPEVVVEIRRK